MSRASFEKTVDQLITAAVFGEKDLMRSVSSRIMAGQVIKGGTGTPNILLDTDIVEKSEYNEQLRPKGGVTVANDSLIADITSKDIQDIQLYI